MLYDKLSRRVHNPIEMKTIERDFSLQRKLARVLKPIEFQEELIQNYSMGDSYNSGLGGADRSS